MFYYILYFVERSHDFYFLICILAETSVVDLYRADKCLVDINSLTKKRKLKWNGCIIIKSYVKLYVTED